MSWKRRAGSPPFADDLKVVRPDRRSTAIVCSSSQIVRMACHMGCFAFDLTDI
jgi:hypothetical protein